jgi:3-oxoadipate enol-lactonase
MPALQLPDTFLAYETEGQGEPVVFLNGIMMSIASWAQQRKLFSERYQCIFYDFRDQLLSGKVSAPYSMDVHVRDLERLLDHLGVQQCHIVGTSYGGEVGMLFALAHPERVKTLSVIASVPWSDALLRLQVGLWRQAAVFSGQWLYETLAAFSFSAGFLGAQPDFIRNGIERVASLPPDYFYGFARLCDAFLELDIRDQLIHIQAPTLIVSPDADILKVPYYSRYMAERIPGAKLWNISGAGHAVVLEQPELINKGLAEFMEGSRF